MSNAAGSISSSAIVWGGFCSQHHIRWRTKANSARWFTEVVIAHSQPIVVVTLNSSMAKKMHVPRGHYLRMTDLY